VKGKDDNKGVKEVREYRRGSVIRYVYTHLIIQLHG
jgi:hypothetical protein